MKRMFILALLLLFGATAEAVCNAGFTTSTLSNGQVQLTNTSTFSGYSAMTGASYQIAWGDGLYSYSSSQTSVNHSYATTGTYTVVLTMWVFDSAAAPNQQVCTSNYSQSVSAVGTTSASCSFSIIHSGAGLTKTFTASNAANLPNANFQWNFGDGSTGSGNPVSHTYQYGGFYNLTATNSSCQGTMYSLDTVVGPVNCDSAQLSFSYSNGNLQALHWTGAPQNGDSVAFEWNFGNGNNSTNGLGFQHPNYSPGTYTVTVTVHHYAPGSSTVSYCHKSYTSTITVPVPGLASISGYISKDTTLIADTFRVWLIAHDSVANTLTAIDSTDVTGYALAFYIFPNVPAGDYLTKAALLSGPSSGPGYIPTYHQTSLYWSSATTIHHGSSNSTNKHIWMQLGTVTSGPGFVGGSIALGANKGTGSGMKGVTVLIRNTALQAIQYSTTDGNGQYQFSNLPAGTYTIYPEITGYQTDPITVTITASASSSTDNNFTVSQNGKTVKPDGLGLLNSKVRSAQLQLYPNPARGSISLSWKAEGVQPVSIRVVNSMGVEVYRSMQQNTGKAELQLGQLPRGTYWLRLNAGGASDARQLVLE